MENNWDDQGDERSEDSGWCRQKENFEGQAMESLSLKEQRKQGTRPQQISTVRSKNVFNHEKVTLIPPLLPPQAYRYKDIYSSRKDLLIQKCIEQERKQREFHSRPMPNFRQAHERQAMRIVEHRITMPVTPNVLRISLETEQKRRQREEQLLREREEETKLKQQQCLRVKPIPASSRQPLKPMNRQPASSSTVKMQPFNLSTEQRVQQRRVFNAQNSQLQEMKRRELEEQRQRREREAHQRQRQLTTFRARPNPFAGTTR